MLAHIFFTTFIFAASYSGGNGVLFLEAKLPGLEDELSYPSSSKVRNNWR
jgi:hypothetical protein